MCTVLHKEEGLELSKSFVCSLLQQLGLGPQRLIYRVYQRDPANSGEYLEQTFPELRMLASRLGTEIYFVDESAVRSDHDRETTRALIGSTPVVGDSGDRLGIKLISAGTLRGDMRCLRRSRAACIPTNSFRF